MILKSVKVKRVRWLRVVRLGVVATVVVCLWWAALSDPTPPHSMPPQALRGQAGIGNPLQFPAPNPSSRSDFDSSVFLSRSQPHPHPLEEPAKIFEEEEGKGAPRVRGGQDVHPRYNMKAIGDEENLVGPRLHRNRPFFHEKQLDIPEDIEEEEVVEEKEGNLNPEDEHNKALEEDDYKDDNHNKKEGEEEVKKEENVAMEVDEEEEYDDEEEEEKEDPGDGMKNGEKNAAVEEIDDAGEGKYEDEPILEDVGGEKMKGKSQRGKKGKTIKKISSVGKEKGDRKTKEGDLRKVMEDINDKNNDNLLNKDNYRYINKIENISKNSKVFKDFDQKEGNKFMVNQFNPEADTFDRENRIDNFESWRSDQYKMKILNPEVREIIQRAEIVNWKAKMKVRKRSLSSEYKGEGRIVKEMEERKRRVLEVCKEYGLGPQAPPGVTPSVKHPPTPNYDVFFIDRSDKLAWCPIYKAASTSWLYTFLGLAGLSESNVHNGKEQVSQVARRMWPPLDYQEAEQAMNTCLKFVVVRHPFERLVSAFRDKLENTNIGKEHGVDHFYRKYGRKIVSKYRPGGELGPLPHNRYSQDMDDPSIPKPKGTEPTFPEFVRYLIDTDLVFYADDHWMPYYLHCTPCLVNYDVIAKFETLQRDQEYIIRRAGLEGKAKLMWKHLTKGRKTVDTVRKYFATITKTELVKLYGKYRLDFEMFGYSIDEYLDYVMPSGV